MSIKIKSIKYLNFNSIPPTNPVDGHHPNQPERKVYPDSGHRLRKEDIGKKMIRTFPARGNTDWSYVPDSSSIKHIHKAAVKILNFKTDGIEVDSWGFIQHILPSEWDDNHWLTVEEFSQLVGATSKIKPPEKSKLTSQVDKPAMEAESKTSFFLDVGMSGWSIPKYIEISRDIEGDGYIGCNYMGCNLDTATTATSLKTLNGDEIAEACISEMVFTTALDKKPVLATHGCNPCVALAGYEATNKAAFLVHFQKAKEVRDNWCLILYHFNKLIKKDIEKPIQLYIRGGGGEILESILKCTKNWKEYGKNLPMEIATQDICGALSPPKSLLIDSRTGQVEDYNPLENPKYKEWRLKSISALSKVYDSLLRPDNPMLLDLAYQPKE